MIVSAASAFTVSFAVTVVSAAVAFTVSLAVTMMSAASAFTVSLAVTMVSAASAFTMSLAVTFAMASAATTLTAAATASLACHDLQILGDLLAGGIVALEHLAHEMEGHAGKGMVEVYLHLVVSDCYDAAIEALAFGVL